MGTYEVMGLIILVCFYGSYYLKMFMQGKNGIKTDRMARGNKPKKTFIIEIILKTTTFIMAVVQVVSIIFYEKMFTFSENNIIRSIGIMASIIGTLVFVIAMITMKDSWRAGIDNTQKTKIVQTGIYKYSRNPAFVGFDLFYIGNTIAFSNLLNILVTIALIIMFHFQILEEEKYLDVEFGKDYLEYKKKTSRYIGRKNSV